ncbi:SUMF1/EgtB/PvdO family nonheme iron enzyme [Leptolyngbya sp. Heron Island J]|uniref:SUMF1/EgtB/PvdO family nonheme iron enzyme n=1 Tax=Leptolyngbya sp. Heron Island J TaxID=1385935 RepID=UPI001F1B7987|nr:SUMF1/EgtB/PvdO family nonheme iron enzyme [Leptolyngbya sp. Heron Island J]
MALTREHLLMAVPGLDSFKGKMIRGGSWYRYPEPCRSARRSFIRPGDRNDLIGFRVVSVPSRVLS